jgi:hypothetical protein
VEPGKGLGTRKMTCPVCQKPFETFKGLGKYCSAECRTRAMNLRHLYGVTSVQYAEMRAAYGDMCAICRRTCDTGDRLGVDHDHRTGRVRGLLCRRCNSALGFFRDDIDLIKAAVRYLERNYADNRD